MPWFRLEDTFHHHPKVMRAGNGPVGLWVRCGTWSAAYLTDGMVPADIAAMYGRTREIETLVATRLWVEVDGGFLMPDYLDYNPSKADVVQRRKADAERKREARGQGSASVGRGRDGRFTPLVGDDPFT
jgi:hypothetical protein